MNDSRVKSILISIGIILLTPLIADAYKIKLQLTGDVNFPGILKMSAGADKKFDRLCFLGQDALGLIDLSFLETLAESGIPEGSYKVAHALPDEKWPTRSFSPMEH